MMRPRTIPFVIFFALLLPQSVSAKLIFGPYLQSSAPDTMLVCAYTDGAEQAVVRFYSQEQEQKDIPAEGVQPVCARITGLQPDEVYHYQLLLDGQIVAGEEPLSMVADSRDDVTFAVYGDTRSGDQSFDLKHREVAQALRDTVVPDFFIHTGDFVERGDDLDLWINFFRIEQDILATAPLFPAIGQSDQPAEMMKKFFPVLAQSPWYSFDRGDAHFSVLNLWLSRSQPDTENSEDGAQATWLKQDLARARARGAKYLFVVMHEPPFDSLGNYTTSARKVFIPIFETFQVTAVFSGAHYFSHVVRNKVHYFTNGGGGAALDQAQPREGLFRFFSAIHHFLVVKVDRLGARVSTVNSFGETFYEVDLDESATGVIDPNAPVFVRSYESGTGSLAFTVFHVPGCEECEEFAERLPTIAQEAGLTMVVTFRSLETPENEALLATVTEQTGPTPIVLIGERVLVGEEDVGRNLASALFEEKAKQNEKKNSSGIWLAFGGAGLAGIVLFIALRQWVKARRRKNTQ